MAGRTSGRWSLSGRPCPLSPTPRSSGWLGWAGAIEAHFGRPQDIEWCLAGDDFVVVQSRPITTLFPVPATDDGRHHVYISVGHQQMMTDPMKPLGLSFWQRTTRASMVEAGGRLFVDVAPVLASPTGRAGFLDMVRRSDPLIGDALQSVVDRGDPLSPVPHEQLPEGTGRGPRPRRSTPTRRSSAN